MSERDYTWPPPADDTMRFLDMHRPHGAVVGVLHEPDKTVTLYISIPGGSIGCSLSAANAAALIALLQPKETE